MVHDDGDTKRMNSPRTLMGGGMKLKMALVMVLAFMLSLSLIACDEQGNSLVGPDSTNTAALVGTWVRVSATVDGEEIFDPFTVSLNTDSTGTNWQLNTEQGGVVEEALTWSIHGDTLTVNTVGGEVMPLTFAFDGLNSITLTYEMDGATHVETLVRWGIGHDSGLVGDWELTSLTRDGETLDPGYNRVTLAEDGTGTTDTDGGDESITWSTTGNTLLVMHNNHLADVFAYAASSASVTLTQPRPDGIYNLIYTAYEPPAGLDADLFGSWAAEMVYDENNQDPNPELVIFRTDGTGESRSMDYDSLRVSPFTWTTSGDTLYANMTDESETFTATYSFVDNGLQVVEFGGTEPSTTTLWKITDDRPADTIGRWIQEDPAVSDNQVEVSVTLDLKDDGEATIYSKGMDSRDGQEWYEYEDVETYQWSTSFDRLIMVDEENNLAFAIHFTVDGLTATLEDAVPEQRIFRKFEGLNPASLAGDWVETDLHFGSQQVPVGGTEVILHEDGTGMFYERHEEGGQEGEPNFVVNVDTLEWVAADDVMMVFYTDRHEGQVLSMAQNGDQMQITFNQYIPEFGGMMVADVQMVRDIGEMDAALPGVWEKSGETVDGVDNPDYTAATVSFDATGNGAYTEDGNPSDPFLWTTNAGYLIVRNNPDNPEIPTAMAYTVNGDQLQVTSINTMNGPDMVSTTVETFTRLP